MSIEEIKRRKKIKLTKYIKFPNNINLIKSILKQTFLIHNKIQQILFVQ